MKRICADSATGAAKKMSYCSLIFNCLGNFYMQGQKLMIQHASHSLERYYNV